MRLHIDVNVSYVHQCTVLTSIKQEKPKAMKNVPRFFFAGCAKIFLLLLLLMFGAVCCYRCCRMMKLYNFKE